MPARIILLSSIFAFAFSASCGGTETSSSTSSQSAGSGGDTGGGSGSSSGGTVGSGGASGASNLCGGKACAFGERCAHKTCGAPNSDGQCKTIPPDCIYPPDFWAPVCGCDGRVRPFSCGELDTAPSEKCTMFPCGRSECVIATQYCERQVSDVGGVPDVYSCKPLPAGCAGATTCECVVSEPCGAKCVGTGSLGLKLTCPGG